MADEENDDNFIDIEDGDEEGEGNVSIIYFKNISRDLILKEL